MPKTETPFGQLLRIHRHARKLTYRAAAWRCHLSINGYMRIEHGYVENPTWATVMRLADGLAVSTEELRTDTIR